MVEIPDSITLVEQLTSSNSEQRHMALNKLLKVSCSHDANYALGAQGDAVLEALVNIVFQCLRWDPPLPQEESTTNNDDHKEELSTRSPSSPTTTTPPPPTFVASQAWNVPPTSQDHAWAQHCIQEYHTLRGQTSTESQERSQLLDAISVILRNLSYVAANLRLLAWTPSVLQVLIGFLYDCGNNVNLLGGSDSLTESSSSTATSNSSSLALHSLQTLVHLAPYLDVTGQKMYADLLFLIPTTLDVEGLLPSRHQDYGQARQKLGWGGMWLAKRLDTKEDIVAEASPDTILEHTSEYLASVWSLFPALSHVLSCKTSPRTVIMTAMDFVKEVLDHHASGYFGEEEEDDDDDEEHMHKNETTKNDNTNNNNNNNAAVPKKEEGLQEMIGIGEDQIKAPTPKKHTSTSTKTTKSIPNARKIMIHIPDSILDRLVDLLWVPRLGPDSLEYLNPVQHIVSRVSTLKLLMGYDATVDTDLRDRSLDVLVPLLELSSPKLAKRLGLVPTTGRANRRRRSTAATTTTTRTRLYDALVPALTTTVGRNDAPNLASELLGQLAKAKENRIGLLYVQSRLLKLASRDPRVAQLACHQLYPSYDIVEEPQEEEEEEEGEDVVVAVE